MFFLFYFAPQHPTGGRQSRLLLSVDQRKHGEEKRSWFDAKKRDIGIDHGSIKEEEIFNSTKHEVPSGPNPVSNR